MTVDEARGRAVLSVDEVHQLIGPDRISERSLYAAIGRGEIPSVRLGRRYLIPVRPLLEKFGIDNDPDAAGRRSDAAD